MPEKISENYLPFCETARQEEILRCVLKHDSQGKAARELGIDRRNVEQSISRIRKHAAKRGYQPENGFNTVFPDTQGVERVTREVDADGNITRQWFKSKAEQTQLDIEAITQGFNENIKPAKRVKKPKTTDEDWLFELPIGDAHIGLYAHHSDGGGDYDLSIAYDDLTNAAYELIEWARPASRCLIVNLGDFYHADDITAQTPKSKNILDVDSRRYKVITTGVQIMCDMIECALEKFGTVHVRNARGNHDINSSMWLTVAMQAYYRNEPRVVVEDSQQDMWAYRFGNNLIGVTHGDTIKPKDMGKVLAHDYAQQWGNSAHRYVHYGHLHSTRVDEDMGCDIERFRILAPNDTYHQQHGYRSKRGMTGIMYHKEYGQSERMFACLQRIRELGL